MQFHNLNNFIKASNQNNFAKGFLKRDTFYDKVIRALDILKQIDDIWKGELSNTLLEDMFNIDMLKSFEFQESHADDWFRANWRLLITDESIKNEFLVSVYNKLPLSAKGHAYNFFKKGVPIKSDLYTFVINLETISDMLKIVGGTGGFPLTNPYSNHQTGKYAGYYFKHYYLQILDAYSQVMLNKFPDSDGFRVINRDDVYYYFMTGEREMNFKLYQLLIMESLTRLFVDTFFGGDIAKYNTFNLAIVEGDTSVITTPVYPPENVAKYNGLSWLASYLENDRSKLYIGPRTIDLRTTGIRIDELGLAVTYELVQDSFSEANVLYRNFGYKDDLGNWHMVDNNIRGDTALFASLQKMGLEYQYFERETPEWDGRETKGMAGDFIRFLGQMYGAQALKSLYIENAGMTAPYYLKKKPFDIIGLRANIHAPTVCIVPVGELNAYAKNGLKNEILNRNDGKHPHGNTLAKIFGVDGSGLDAITTYVDYYRAVIKHGGELIGQFSVVMDHKERRLFDRSRLMASEQGLGPFDGLMGFINHIRDIDFSIYPDDSYVKSFNERLGLTETQAKKIVEAYGLTWADGFVGNHLWSQSSVLSWYADLEASTHYTLDATPVNNWAHFAHMFYHQHIAETSGHIYLLYKPYDWNTWMMNHNMAGQVPSFDSDMFWLSSTQWLDPAWPLTQVPFPEMGYFDAEFLDTIDSITLSRYTIPFLEGDHVDLVSLLEYLYSKKWYERFD